VTEPAVDRYMAGLATRLPGPSRIRSQIVAELRDGLLEAICERRQAGLGHGQAVRLALEEFGDPQTVSSAFLPELSAARARRVVWGLLLASPIIVALWMSAASVMPEQASNGSVNWLSTHLPGALLILATAGCAVWAIAATGQVSCWLRLSPGGSVRGAAAISRLTALADAAALLMLATRLIGFPGPTHLVALAAAMAASLTRLVVASRAKPSAAAARG
jgi:hypothetical protein